MTKRQVETVLLKMTDIVSRTIKRAKKSQSPVLERLIKEKEPLGGGEPAGRLRNSYLGNANAALPGRQAAERNGSLSDKGA
jgi:hypothetical protein